MAPDLVADFKDPQQDAWGTPPKLAEGPGPRGNSPGRGGCLPPYPQIATSQQAGLGQGQQDC